MYLEHIVVNQLYAPEELLIDSDKNFGVSTTDKVINVLQTPISLGNLEN